MAVTLKVKKESLCDWRVTNGTEHVAWIERRDHLYNVRYGTDPHLYHFLRFKQAKDFIRETEEEREQFEPKDRIAR